MTIPVLTSLGRNWLSTLPTISFVTISLALAGYLAFTAAAAAAPPTEKVAAQAPRITYQYQSDSELMTATENAASYCGQYHAQPHTADIRNTATKGKAVTFDCLGANVPIVATVSATTVGSDLVYPYSTDQELVDVSWNTNAYCIQSGSPGVDAVFTTSADGTKTVTMHCAP